MKSLYAHYMKAPVAELQIRRGNWENDYCSLYLNKNIRCDLSLEYRIGKTDLIGGHICC